MVHQGNPAIRDWAGTQRLRIQRAVYASSDTCWLCGHQVDRQANPRSPRAPSVDHVIPRHLGGDPYDLANCRLAHLGCNSARGKRLARRASAASRRW
jgi:5-methylcytosine-specific restriction endonuclease McrA